MRNGNFESLRELGLVPAFMVDRVGKDGFYINSDISSEFVNLMSLLRYDIKMRYLTELSKYGFLEKDMMDFQEYLKGLPLERKKEEIKKVPETINAFLGYARVHGYQDDDLGLITLSLELGESTWNDFFEYHWKLKLFYASRP